MSLSLINIKLYPESLVQISQEFFLTKTKQILENCKEILNG